MSTSAAQVQYPHEPISHGSYGAPPSSPAPQFSVVTAEHETRPDAGERGQEVWKMANQLYQQNPDWVTFFREVLGLNGYVRQAFKSREELDQFEQTEQYEQIQVMLAKLRERNSSAKQPCSSFEPTRVITVRLPKSLHESLRAEAHEKRTSMNKLCISKLLQFIDTDLVPTET
jgi:predicted HicB family RNase H-like nuclease